MQISHFKMPPMRRGCAVILVFVVVLGHLWRSKLFQGYVEISMGYPGSSMDVHLKLLYFWLFSAFVCVCLVLSWYYMAHQLIFDWIFILLNTTCYELHHIWYHMLRTTSYSIIHATNKINYWCTKHCRRPFGPPSPRLVRVVKGGKPQLRDF